MDTKPPTVNAPGYWNRGLDVGLGKGIPQYFMTLINRNKDLDKKDKQQTEKQELGAEDFSSYAANLNLEEFKFKDGEEEAIELQKKDEKQLESSLAMDVTALDRYNDEVRRHRKSLIDECRHLPPTVDEESAHILVPLEEALEKLSRNTYYGTPKAQKLSEGAIPLIIWLASKRFFPESFTVNVIKNVSEMCWNAAGLKQKFAKHHGTRVLYHSMLHSTTNRRLACWATYALAMIGTGAADVIHAAQGINGMEELVNELSFDYYWYDWPVNFGMVLQGVLYGPNSVAPSEELFQFQ